MRHLTLFTCRVSPSNEGLGVRGRVRVVLMFWCFFDMIFDIFEDPEAVVAFEWRFIGSSAFSATANTKCVCMCIWMTAYKLILSLNGSSSAVWFISHYAILVLMSVFVHWWIPCLSSNIFTFDRQSFASLCRWICTCSVYA